MTHLHVEFPIIAKIIYIHAVFSSLKYTK